MIRTWYKDRDFPEIKAQKQNEPSDILAVVQDLDGLKTLIKEHNELVELCYKYETTLRNIKKHGDHLYWDSNWVKYCLDMINGALNEKD